MVFSIFFLTITISKRKYSGADLERAYRAQQLEKYVDETKHHGLTWSQRFL